MSFVNPTQGTSQNNARTEPSNGSSSERRPPAQDTNGRTGYGDRSARGSAQNQAKQEDSDNLSALKLVQRASETIDMLQDRCRQLESDIKDLNDRLRSESESSERVIKDWERLAAAIKAQLGESEARGAELQQRLKATEDRAETLETRALAGEARADAAEELASRQGELATTFRDTILENFGSGSRLSAVLAGSSGT